MQTLGSESLHLNPGPATEQPCGFVALSELLLSLVPLPVREGRIHGADHTRSLSQMQHLGTMAAVILAGYIVALFSLLPFYSLMHSL
jgi:hypothetical protein